MQLQPSRPQPKAQGATDRERRPHIRRSPLPILHPKDARAHTAASVCHNEPARPQVSPGLPGSEDHPELQALLDDVDGRNSFHPLEASLASDRGLLIDSTSTGAAGGAEYYPEELAKTHTKEEKPLDVACPSHFAVAGQCHENHYFARETYCGREYCPICGVNGSAMHERRKSRWYPKIQQCRTVGYMVATVPPEEREDYRTKKALGAFGTAFTRLLKRNGIERGVRRWHFFGEQEGTEAPEFHPHINALVDEGYIEPERLESIRRGLARILGVSVDRVNLHYEYSSEIPQILHWVKYVTRATFLDWRWDEGLARELVGFHNATPWGSWLDEDGNHLPPVWEIPAAPEGENCEDLRQVVALEQSRCPFDGTPIVWKGVIKRDKLTHPTERRWYRIGAGYWTKGEARWAGS